MTNDIFNIKRGLKARLEAIPGLRVITFEPEDWRDFPVAVIRTESRSATRAGVTGSRFEAEFVVTVMAGGSKRSESHDALDSYIATDGDMSVEAAIATDPTLGGVAERAYPVGVENIRVMRMGGGRYAAADFRIRVELWTAPRRSAVIEATATLSNEQDGPNHNYFDVTNVAGALGAPAQIKIQDPSGSWSGSGKTWISRRSVERRADKLFFQADSGAITQGETIFEESDAIWSGSVQPMSGASGGKYARMAWTKAGRYTTRTGFTLCGHVRTSIASADIPRGRFRVLSRVRTETDNSELQMGHMGFALGWSFGAESESPEEGDAVFPQVAGEFRTLDLGELTLPPTPVPDGYSTAGLDLDIHAALREGGADNNVGTHHFRWSVDYVLMLPIDEGEVVVNWVESSQRVLLDTLSEVGSGVYLLDESDAVLGPADFEGAPFRIGPEDTRIYMVRDDAADPSSVRFGLTTLYAPPTAGM